MNGSQLSIHLSSLLEYVPLESFVTVAEQCRAILVQVDSAISGLAGGSVKWAVTDLAVGSAAIRIAPFPSEEDSTDYGPAVIRAFLAGLRTLELGRGQPQHFSDQALLAAKRLAGVLIDSVTSLTISSDTDTVAITPRLAASVDELVSPRFTSIGTVEGTLETISVHGGRQYFNIYDSVAGRRVYCSFHTDLLEQAKEALGKRVVVWGKITSNARGTPMSAEATRLTQLRDRRELPQVKDLIALDPDFTGGLPSDQYLRRMRDADG